MALPFVMLLPLLIVVAAGVYYIYNEVMQFMSKSLVQNKVVVITDAVSGAGSECARLFHKGGARLILCGPSWDKLESLYDSLTNDADPKETFAPKLVILDFSDMDSMEDVVSEVVDCYSCVDVLICNSSVKLRAAVQTVSLELERDVMDINYFGPSTLVKGVLPMMISRRSGHIVLVNSIQGRLAVPFRSSYAASKHATQAFFESLRAEVEEYGIVISTISHTFINASPLPPPPPASEESGLKPKPKPNSLAAFIAGQLTHGVRPAVLANEIMQTVNRKKKEVMLVHPIPRVALYLRSLLPSFLFAVLAAGTKDAVFVEQMQ
ncbi:dehydrogenase/reductase (SDR family) member 7Cb [Thalassophryne amazonica]|uniref:dehydrogenase/reductase (SDR family) member 7Cb n=1 Tax=Thalassophryne amazonica TaxID=390379 RepID=UPI001470A869|nr:dehydrogenase/reductase (SDR family) member 7Cb [Thalassophryne amazonica]XP_034050506.1 dehydrogenase/reductase (SDR family) member 7Cb [Thalassophryne amazonica]XP_034050507.1 dehydrogenase/reductase (SDR family) member 7Cb [Thalassophryne amazonica]